MKHGFGRHPGNPPLQADGRSTQTQSRPDSAGLFQGFSGAIFLHSSTYPQIVVDAWLKGHTGRLVTLSPSPPRQIRPGQCWEPFSRACTRSSASASHTTQHTLRACPAICIEHTQEGGTHQPRGPPLASTLLNCGLRRVTTKRCCCPDSSSPWDPHSPF